MNKYLRIELSERKEFRCKGSIKLFGNYYNALDCKIDTGCPMTTIPLKKTQMDELRIYENMMKDYKDSSVKKTVSFGVNDSDMDRKRNIELFKEGRFELLNSVTCEKQIEDFKLNGCNLGTKTVRVSYTRTGNILIGMDILKTLDIHIATIDSGETIMLACPKDQINDEYLIELEKIYRLGSNIESALARNLWHSYIGGIYMLLIYFKNRENYDKSKVVDNAELAFRNLDINWDETDNKLISEIDKGKLQGADFIDRFGRNLPLDAISCGCKCALVVNHNPDKVINTIECGRNAIDAIIKYIKNGDVVWDYGGLTVHYSKNAQIDVCIEGKFRITNLERLNYYLMYEKYSDDVDTSIEGIEIL
jgi:hypothetical protein